MSHHLRKSDIARVRRFLLARWQERAAELGRPKPEDLTGACKFCSLFGEAVFGGEIQGNAEHQFNLIGGQTVDFTGSGLPLQHDPEFFGNPEHQSSMDSCASRVEQWVSMYEAESIGQ